MNDTEIEGLLRDAGYQYDLAAGLYALVDGPEQEYYDAEEVSDTLEIPLDDLFRWESEQRHADETSRE
ncbi:MAG: hypothetical protein ABSF29_02610 [Tepidisphaeraceae bacterium]|jgi:hypothetical protein